MPEQPQHLSLLMNEPTKSTPSFSEFDPSEIPFQDTVVDDVLCNYDYKKGTHEILLSGSVGSAKSILAAHLIIRHCFDYPGARVLIGRKALPQLRDTIYTKLKEHLDQPDLIHKKDYWCNDSQCWIKFKNNSEILSTTWSDNKFSKIRSYEISAAFIEEGSESDNIKAYQEILMRCGRLPHVPQKWLMVATNPDSPGHWLYKRFMQEPTPSRHVYYSKTEDNPFLPTEYIQGLKENLDPKMARRMLYGEWIDIDEDRVYHSYDSDTQYLKDVTYEIKPGHPIAVCFDFNIGQGKPMSSCAYQFIDGVFHVFKEVVVQGARTNDVMDEWFETGLLTSGQEIVVHGDASGANRDTRNIQSDYDIIKKYLSNIPNSKFRMEVPRANPPIRSRHNIVNAHCKNELGKTRLYVYKGCKTVDEGLRLTSLKAGGNYVEDDSKHFQHITTALGYGIVYETNRVRKQIEFQKR
jgi:hypothetical protein